MTVPAEKSFEIRTARQFLNEVLRPNLTDFLQNPTSSRKAINCAQSAWHLYDWVWKQHEIDVRTVLGVQSKSDLVVLLFREFPKLKLINEIANGSKHVQFGERKGPPSKVTKTGRGHVYGTGLLLPRDKPCLFVCTDDTAYMADDLFKWVLDDWDKLFTRLGL